MDGTERHLGDLGWGIPAIDEVDPTKIGKTSIFSRKNPDFIT